MHLQCASMPALVGAALTLASPSVLGQSPLRACGAASQAAWCSAAPGERPGGWVQQRRSEVMARNGMVATSQPLAAQAGLDILKRGGNAIDAAVATAAVLSVVEPMSTGVAGDMFAVIYIAKDNKVYALNASGKAPTGATLERMNLLGYQWDPKRWGTGSGMPTGGILPVTVPGAAWGWDEVLRRFGSMSFKETLQAAIDYAETGFAVSEVIALGWVLPKSLPPEPSNPGRCCTQLDPDSVATWYVAGVPPVAGQLFRNPDLARTLRILQRQGRDGFYKGDIARAIVAKSNAVGGTMTLQDLAAYSGQWVTPATTSYHGFDLFMLPPPAQTWATAEMTNVLEACVPIWAPGKTLASLGPANPKYWHLMVEAKKLAYADLIAYNGDPDHVPVPLKRLLSKAYARSLCSRVDPDRASTPGPMAEADRRGDTIVLSTADRFGNMVAWVSSNFFEFGSGLTVPGYGFVLHNRGALFTLDPKSPNVIAPQKRPFNTLSAGFVMQNNRPLMTVTLMGGDMQAQGIAQVLVNILDLGANMQAASDMARFHHGQVSNTLRLERDLHRLVAAPLAAMGHQVELATDDWVGGYQAIMVVPDARTLSAEGAVAPAVTFRGGSDHRKDGQVVGY
jgi:gamma-glutamyltranspeptidase/glutathione hydrolase